MTTKFGTRRVRRDPPTVDEALFAAAGLSDDVEQQIDIAASLMDMPRETVRLAMAKAKGQRKDVNTSVIFSGRSSSPRAVVVQRKSSRRAR